MTSQIPINTNAANSTSRPSSSDNSAENISRSMQSLSVDVNTKDDQGRSPLALALVENNIDLAKRLLDDGADPKAIDNDGDPLIWYAVLVRDEQLLQLLYRAADESAINWKLLYMAIRAGNHLLIYKLLQRENIDLEFYQGHGDTTVHTAIRCGRGSLVPQLLQQAGRSILSFQSNGETPLMTALAIGYDEIAVALSSITEFDNSLVTTEGLTVFDLAVQNCQPRTVLHLLHKEPSIMRLTGLSGKPPILSVVTTNQPEVLLYMISEGVDITARGKNGEVPFIEAVRRCNIGVIDILISRRGWLEQTADGSWRCMTDNLGESPLHASVDSLKPEILRKVLELEDIDVATMNDLSRTALHKAVEVSSYEMVEMLLEAKSPLNTVEVFGKTVLDTALILGDKRIIEILLNHGAIVGVEWPDKFIDRYTDELWFQHLKRIIEENKPEPTTGRFEINPRWIIGTVTQNLTTEFNKTSADHPYFEILIPFSNDGSFRVRRIVFTRDSRNEGPFTYGMKPFQMNILRKYGRQAIPRFHAQSNLHEDLVKSTYSNYWDYRDPSCQWLAAIESGDLIQIFPESCLTPWNELLTQIKIRIFLEKVPLETAKSENQVAHRTMPSRAWPVINFFYDLQPLLNDKSSFTYQLPGHIHTATHLTLSTLLWDGDSKSFDLPGNLNKATQLESFWQKAREVQSSNIKILLKVQNVPETQAELKDFCAALKHMVKSHNLDGIDFDVTGHHSINGTITLIDFLKTSFGYHFIIVISPHITALQGGDKDSTYSYEYLEILRGDQIAWYSLNTYNPRCQQTATNALDIREYQDIMNRGWPMGKLMLGFDASINHQDGFVSPTALKLFLAAISVMDGAHSIGVGLWICTTCSQNVEHIGEWTKSVMEIISKYFKNSSKNSSERYSTSFGMQMRIKSRGRGNEMFKMLKGIGLEPDKSEIRRVEVVSMRERSFGERAVPPMSDIMPMHLRNFPLLSKNLKYMASPLIDKGSIAAANSVQAERDTKRGVESRDVELIIYELGATPEVSETTVHT